MKRLAKILASVLAIVIVLIIVAVIALPFVFDPNAHKAEITALIEQRIGRDVTIPGEIDLSVFPWLGVSIGKVTVANGPGFGDEPLAEIGSAQVRVKLWPLVHKQIEIGTVALNGLRLHLARNAKGRTNWAGIVEHLSAGSTTETAQKQAVENAGTEQDGGFNLTSLQVGSIVVEDAAITWNDAVTGSSYRLSNFYLTTGALAEDQPFKLKTGATLAAATRGLTGHIVVTTQVQPDVSASVYRFNDIKIQLDASGKSIPGGEQEAVLTGQGVLNLAAGQFAFKNLDIQAAGLAVSAEVSGKGLNGAPQFSTRFEVAQFSPDAVLDGLGMEDALSAGDGQVALSGQVSLNLGAGEFALTNVKIQAGGLAATAALSGHGLGKSPALSGKLAVAEFNPRQLLKSFGAAIPQLQGEKVLRKAALQMQFAATPSSAKINQLKLTLDDSVFTGTASVDGFSAPSIAFDANVNAFNLDHYLPVATAQEAVGQGKSGGQSSGSAGGATKIDLSFLRGLTLDGKLHVGKLTAYGMSFNDAALAVAARGGVLTIKPLASGFYDGNIHVVATVDASGKVPQYSLQADLAKLKFAPLLKDLVGTDMVSALASLKLDLTSSGGTVGAIKQALDGNVSFDLSDGTFYGFNLAHLIAVAKSRVLDGSAPKLAGKQVTPFSHFAGSFDINNGVLSGDGLKLTTKYLGAAGAGQYNLLANNLDYDLKIHVDEKDAGPLSEVAGLTVPIHLTGSLFSPQYSIDIKALLKSLAKQHLQDEKAELQEKVKDKKQELKKKLSDKLSEELGDKASDQLGDKLDKKLQEGLSNLFN